jgi:glutamate dehydrogenase (NAD(P)+)
MALEDQLTGYGVVIGAAAAAEALGWSLRGATVAVEGLGKVGAGALKYFAREGARVVAVSNVYGLLHRPEGLDVERLLQLRSRYGDAALDRYDGSELLPAQRLFAVPADVVVPGARPDAIHAGNVEVMKARLVAPAANIPYAVGAPALLHARNIVALPDFVTNAGGVLAGLVGLQGGTAADAFALTRERIGANVRLVLDAARARSCTAYDAACALARSRLTTAG